jgi:hypothetical protein
MAILEKTTNAGEGVGKRNPIHWECILVQPLWKSICRFIQRLKIQLLYDLAIPLLGIDLRDCKSTYKTDIHKRMSSAALFTVAKMRNQPRCSTVNE